jgi:hypothetical protein
MYTLTENYTDNGTTYSKGISFKKYTIEGENLIMGAICIPLSVLQYTEEKIYKKIKKPRQIEEKVVLSNSARVSDRPDLLK